MSTERSLLRFCRLRLLTRPQFELWVTTATVSPISTTSQVYLSSFINRCSWLQEALFHSSSHPPVQSWLLPNPAFSSKQPSQLALSCLPTACTTT